MHLDKEIINLKEIILKLDETYGKPGSSLKRELWSSFNALNEAINYKSSCTELKALDELKQWCYETCEPFQEERLHEIIKRL